MHIAYDDKDLYGIDLIFKEWSRKGMVGSVDSSHSGQGYVSISTANWKKNDGSYVTMELHKLQGEKGFFGQKQNWVVRLLSAPYKGSNSVTMHGCVDGRNQLAALDRALLDVGYNFMSQTKLEDYYVRWGSTPYSRTVVKRLKTSDPAWRVYVAFVGCGTARYNRISPSVPYSGFYKSYDSPAPV